MFLRPTSTVFEIIIVQTKLYSLCHRTYASTEPYSDAVKTVKKKTLLK